MSSSYGAVYAKVPNGDVAALEKAVKEARAVSRHSSPLGVLAFDPALHSFAVVDRWGRTDNMPIWSEDPDLAKAVELVALSRSVGEVLALYLVDDGSTMAVYGAWRDGALVRDLQWMNEQWARVEGESQPWEAPLFSPQGQTKAMDLANGEEHVREILATGKISLHNAWPRPEELAFHMRAICPGPAFGFSPWPRRNELVERNLELDGSLRKKPRG